MTYQKHLNTYFNIYPFSKILTLLLCLCPCYSIVYHLPHCLRVFHYRFYLLLFHSLIIVLRIPCTYMHVWPRIILSIQSIKPHLNISIANLLLRLQRLILLLAGQVLSSYQKTPWWAISEHTLPVFGYGLLISRGLKIRRLSSLLWLRGDRV